jgi:uncharacterized membrane protein
MSDVFAFSDPHYVRVLIVGALCGLFFGIFIARESIKRQAIYGGALAQTFHYLGSATVATIFPMVIVGILSGLRFYQLIGMGLFFLVWTILFMLLFGFFESQAARPTESKPARELD